MKPREFWILQSKDIKCPREVFLVDPKDLIKQYRDVGKINVESIHVRELVDSGHRDPAGVKASNGSQLNWEKLWKDLKVISDSGVLELRIPIQELVEKQLKGQD